MCMIRTGLIVFFITFLGILLSAPMDTTPYDRDDAYATSIGDPCITYDSAKRLISIGCKSARLSDIDNQLHNSSIITRESGIVTDTKTNESTDSSKNWILRAGILVEENSTLVIDSNDTTWLKIVPTPTKQLLKAANETTLDQVADNDGIDNETDEDLVFVSKNNGDSPNGIHVFGSLKIDSVKITSWDPEKKDVIKFDLGKRRGEEHTKSDYDTAEPRPFIRVSGRATATNITNSEIAYLGYSCSRCAGLSYYGGEGSVIKGSNIHHLLKGYYSKNMGHMTIEGNDFHDNYLYGIDPHTGSHDIVIRNNTVHNNNASGIICSKDCYNLLIEGNEAYSNRGSDRGIAFSINTTKSIARDNYIHDQKKCIGFNRESNFNQVYNNTMEDCRFGISVSNTTNNIIYNNKIKDSETGIQYEDRRNQIYDNRFLDVENNLDFDSPS